ncbi:MAG: hypothetical protein V4582_15345 [Pseudomonadota bacterium]
MALLEQLAEVLAYVSRVCGFDTIDAFPPGHAYARTRWNRAYFDIASDQKPEQIERTLCAAISNTPSVFAHIVNPTPRMQRALLEVIGTRVRRSCGSPNDLVTLLIRAFDSPHMVEAIPGLRAAIAASAQHDAAERVRSVLEFLGQMPAAFDVIDAPLQVPR